MSPNKLTLLTSLFGILAIVSLLGNIATCIVVVRWKALHKPINFLLLNLSVANLVVSVFSAPTFVFGPTFEHPSGAAGDILCKFVTGQNFFWVGGVASGFSLSLIAYERFRAVVYPHNFSKRLSGRKLKLTIVLCWTYAFVLNVPNLITSKTTLVDSRRLCRHEWPQEVHKRSWAWFLVLISFVGPLATVAGLYTSTVYYLYRKRTRPNLAQMAVYRSRKRITITLIAITILFALCWAPKGVTYILQAYNSTIAVGRVSLLREVAILLVCVSSALHTVLCALSCRAFRRGFAKILRLSSRVHDVNSPYSRRRGFSRQLTVHRLSSCP